MGRQLSFHFLCFDEGSFRYLPPVFYKLMGASYGGFERGKRVVTTLSVALLDVPHDPTNLRELIQPACSVQVASLRHQG